MSIETRTTIAESRNIVFRTFQQKNDIVRVDGVQTQLIDFLKYLVNNGAMFEVTALKIDHHDDTELNPTSPHCGTHMHGWAIDCWPLYVGKAGAYIDPEDEQFQHFLRLAQKAPHFMQIGLAGTAFTALNRIAAGPSAFEDDGGDHVHLGVQA